MRLNNILTIGAVLFVCCLTGCSTSEKGESKMTTDFDSGREYDLWIKGGKIIDGTGQEAKQGDVLISGDEITFVGIVPGDVLPRATRTIDALGKVVTPGFIDIHSHNDGTPQTNHEDTIFDNSLSMGVTTLALGMCGSSPDDSTNLAQWMKRVEANRPGPNIATFVGHGTLRDASGTGLSPEPTEAQMAKMKAILQKGFDDGAFGLTTGLEYDPGKRSKEKELVELAKVVGKNQGMIMSHMRTEDDDKIEGALTELLHQGKECHVHVSHFKSVYGKGAARGKQLGEMLENARKSGLKVTADMYPYNASQTSIDILYPEWITSENFNEMKVKRRDELLTFVKNKVIKRNGPEATLFTRVNDFPNLVGKTLKDAAAYFNIPFEQVVVDKLGYNGASAVYFVMDQDLQDALANFDYLAFASDGSQKSGHPRSYGTFAKVIRYFVVEKKQFSLETAVRKMTGLSASILPLKDRGLLKVGYKADILVFDPLQVKDNATYLKPNEKASGFDFVIVNGKISKDHGNLVTTNGRILKKN